MAKLNATLSNPPPQSWTSDFRATRVTNKSVLWYLKLVTSARAKWPIKRHALTGILMHRRNIFSDYNGKLINMPSLLMNNGQWAGLLSTESLCHRLFQLHDNTKAKCTQYLEFCTSQWCQNGMCSEFQFSSFIFKAKIICSDASLCVTQHSQVALSSSE